MQLNAFTDYALRVLVFAASRPDTRCRTEEVSTAFGISRHHVIKVVNELQHLGYIETTRGRAGGFRLARSPERINLGAVVRQTEGTLAVVECFDRETNTCPLAGACGVTAALNEAFKAFFGVLDGYTVADLIARPRWFKGLIALTPSSAHGAQPLSHRGQLT